MSQPATTMGSIGTRRLIAVDENLHPSQKALKRKQGSTLRSLKESFKFRGSVNSKKVSSQSGSNTQSSPSKVRRSSGESRKGKQRLSAQRVSLFKYENVRVLSSSMSGSIRRGSDSTASSNTTKSSDAASVSSNRSRSSVKVKPSTLMARGTLEIYQICTPNSSTAEKRQEMNYLSLGRKENIVHPILPRLQVTKVAGSKYKFIIHFYNPDRFWEIEFLPMADTKTLSNVVEEFETVIVTICDYSATNDSAVEEKPPATKKVEIATDPVIHKDKDSEKEENEIEKEETSKEDDDDDLNYLLEEDEEDEENEEQLTNNISQADQCTSENNTDEDVNKAFRKAMHNFKPSCTYRGSMTERFNEVSSKRFSSYQPPNLLEQSQALPNRESYFSPRRSSSVRSWFGDPGSIHITKRESKNFT